MEDTLTALREKGVTSLIIQPIGFLCDHVEILYDIDIGFREFAANLGMTVRRPASLNDSRLLTLALADLAKRGLAKQLRGVKAKRRLARPARITRSLRPRRASEYSDKQ